MSILMKLDEDGFLLSLRGDERNRANIRMQYAVSPSLGFMGKAKVLVRVTLAEMR